MWGEVCRAATMSITFKNLPQALRKDTAAWRDLFDAVEPQSMDLPGEFAKLCAFDKLLIIRMIRPDKLVPAVRLLEAVVGVCALGGYSEGGFGDCALGSLQDTAPQERVPKAVPEKP
jgi:hypothetical protein